MFTSGELSGLQATHNLHMNDEGQLLFPVESYNDLNEVTLSYSTGSAIACGFDPTAGEKRRGLNFTAVKFDATVRFASTTILDINDLFLLTKRFSGSVPTGTAVLYEVVDVQFGSAGFLVGLKRYQP